MGRGIISKTRADTLGDQVNNFAKKIWPQINFDKTGWPYQSTDIPENAILHSGTIFSIQAELKERIIERLQQWKDRALEDKSKLQKKLEMQTKQETEYETKKLKARQEGLLEPKPPEFLQNLLWICKHGMKYWKLILLAIAIIVIWIIFAKFDLLARI